MDVDEVEYYYVTYTCIGILAGAGIVKQKKVEGREPGDFCLANASQYLFKLLEVPVILQTWRLISRKRAEEMDAWAKGVAEKIEGMITDPKSNVTHLRIVPKVEENTPPKSS